MQFLKQNTSIKVAMGPFVDATDGFTLETAIAFATTEANAIKSDAAAVTDIGINTWSAHLGGGYYNVTLTAGNTDTLGMLVLEAHDTAARPVRREFMVVPANIYDSLIAGTDKLDVNLNQINENAIAGFLTGTTRLKTDVELLGANAIASFLSGTTGLNADVTKVSGSATAADNMELAALGIISATVQSGSSTTVVKTNLTEATNDHYNGRLIIFVTGLLAGQAGTITDYAGASKDVTVSILTEAPANGDVFIII